MLKFVLAHPAVTVAIPATTRVDHVRENLSAAAGPMPDLGHAAAHRGPREGALMSEWWTYRAEFLLFSPRVYWRMFELHNAALWPLHLLTLAAGLIAILLIARRPGSGARWLAPILAICGSSSDGRSCGIATRPSTGLPPISRRLSPLKAYCSLIVSLRDGLAFDRRGPAGWTGYLILGFALAGQPLLAPLQGRGWASSEVFGIAPDPTAMATLGVLLLARGRLLPVLLPIPVLWCLLSGLTLRRWANRKPGPPMPSWRSPLRPGSGR